MGKLHTRRTEEETKLPLERNWTKISTETAHEITPPGSKPPDFCDGKARKGVSFFLSILRLLVWWGLRGYLYKCSANLCPWGKWEELFLGRGFLLSLHCFHSVLFSPRGEGETRQGRGGEGPLI
jgi:hypothetical protein